MNISLLGSVLDKEMGNHVMYLIYEKPSKLEGTYNQSGFNRTYYVFDAVRFSIEIICDKI